ncbi:dihydropteroate synthase [Arundinibacter roseus]|uniref:dihydropteroate synthase n=1 Tax=Arundinibacter roseus TaxID=2070510 RepID=A0A4R4KCR8_9BACT|nr:dihydropteroate synthase [Arundinibacter roseus]TDB64526.1 dihydropteroate synthase [Arundinibacter roseus]
MKRSQDTKKTLNVGGRLLDVQRPKVMGILNLTPDSFFTGSRFEADSGSYVQKAGQMLEEGATILDIGGYSTRPNADFVSVQEETDRVLAVVEKLKNAFPGVILSIDTFRAKVARLAISAGAGIINDVSGGNLDEEMFDTVADLGVPYVLMHMRGTPKTMNQLATYDYLIQEIMAELAKKLVQLRAKGVADILIDPGFGFAKTVEQNFELLGNLNQFKQFNVPILAGVSRKSMIWKSLQITADEALNGTTVLNTIALENGATILRVHDVKEACQTVKLWELTQQVN